MQAKEKLVKPSYLEQKKHLKEGASSCLVCGHPVIEGNFTDYDGELKCVICGLPWYTEGNKMRPKDLARMYGLTPEVVAKVYTPYYMNLPILKDFWEVKGQKIPLGIFIDEPPYSSEEYMALWMYIWDNRDRIMPDWEEDFAWNMISQLAQGETPNDKPTDS